MEVAQTVNLYITFVEKEGPFLKIWGQTEKNHSIYVEQFLLGASPQFDIGIGKIALENLQGGTLVCAKYKDNKYYRARITNVGCINEGFVEVSFLDYGNKDLVPCANIRSLQNFPSSFISIPPLATGFIFAEAHCPGGGEWNNAIFDNISKEIKYREVQCTLLTQATQYFLVKLFIGGNDLCTALIQRGLMQPVSLQAQQAVLLSMSIQRQSLPPSQMAPPISSGINTYKACTLEPGCHYPVYVSYVNDGPCHFSVQLKQSEEVLAKLMNDINTIALRLLEDIPIPGTICLARCQEDGNICRAVVTNEVDNQFKVFYVDFGNFEVVPLDALYQIPFKCVLPKVMAIRFSLAGVEKSTVTLEMQCAFKQFVDNRLLHMKVLPTPARTAMPKCELWDPETKTSALDVINRAAQHAYPEPVSLNRGFSQPVKVSYVYSCNRFYVQLASKENELLNLMLDLQSTCLSNDSMDSANIKVGLPCCALFESDQQWYRSQIVEVLGDNAKVRYIDYGNEEVVPVLQLKIIEGEQLTVLRPQAIECCLNGYQNMAEDSERDALLEELILEGQFTMKVVEMINKKALVELFDNSNYNIASLLLDKLASAKSQVSPMLVQAGNKIEHRKSQSHFSVPKDRCFRQDRKPGRDNKSYERNNDRNEKSWRQENKDFRSQDRNSNDNINERSSWRQNNKGFSPTNEKLSRDRNRNRNDWQNKENATTNENDAWETSEAKSPVNNDEWNTPQNNSDFHTESRERDFGHRKDRYDNDKGDWNSGGPKGGGYKKKSDFRKDGSEISSSGSEKSFHKGPRTSSRIDRSKFPKKFDKPRNASFNSSGVDGSWNVSEVSLSTNAAPATATFATYDVVGTESKIAISWFHSPDHFYCQLLDYQEQFKLMMEDIQQFYKSRKPELTVVGAPVIGLFPEDNVLYRAQILEIIGNKYKVYYVDFGNVSTITKVWPIDLKFMDLPAQAIICSLNGIAAPNEKWLEPDTYSNYFGKDTFICKFVNKDEQKTYVNLIDNSDDITQLLIRDGLAISTQLSIPDIEIPLLLGQQFRAVVKSVNNLSDIIIALDCGLAITCMMHNIDTSTETYEDTLKSYLEQTVIVYVDNVIDDKLEVTFYDIEGNKIVIINPDEGAFDSVEALCPHLVLQSTLTGYVTYVDESSIFIQPSEYVEIVALLLDQLFEFYGSQKQDLPIIPEEGLLYAVKGSDDNWYRGRVLLFDDEKATVCYVDYGNSECVSFSDLRELEDKFLQLCICCVQVNVTVPTDSLIDKEVLADINFGENGWEGIVQVLEQSSATEIAFVEAPSEKLTDLQAETEIITDIPIEKNIVIEEALKVVDVEDIPIQSGTQVIVSHIDTPNEFYLQFAEASNAIDKLQLNLQEEVMEMPTLENPTAGVLCAAPYSADQQWYRAEVLDADDDITTVRFVDYGNTDVIVNNTTEIKTLPPNLLSLAVYATRSSLKIKSLDEEWNTNAIERFQALANSEYVTAEFHDQDEKTNYVDLYVDGQSIKDILINENFAAPAELTLESKSTCFVSHLNSPSEFWIQLENCVDELEWIAEQLSLAESFPELEDLTPGTLCAALFPDDEMWYRARILSNTIAGLELLFIDYGNSCISSSLKQLPEDLVVTPPLAQKCSLQKPEGILYWSPQAVAKFNEISADGQTIFTVRKISTGETSVVQLLIEGEDVISLLSPVVENGCITDIESVDSFSIEKDGEMLPEKHKLETLPGMVWNEDSSNKLKELNSQGTVFQIEFLTNNTVRLYLDGKDIRSKLGGEKISSSLNVSKADEELDTVPFEGSLEEIDKLDEIESNLTTLRSDVVELIREGLEHALDQRCIETNEELEASEIGLESNVITENIAEDINTKVKPDYGIEIRSDIGITINEEVEKALNKREIEISADITAVINEEVDKALDKKQKEVSEDLATVINDNIEKALNDKEKEVTEDLVTVINDNIEKALDDKEKEVTEDLATVINYNIEKALDDKEKEVTEDLATVINYNIEKALDDKEKEVTKDLSTIINNQLEKALDKKEITADITSTINVEVEKVLNNKQEEVTTDLATLIDEKIEKVLNEKDEAEYGDLVKNCSEKTLDKKDINKVDKELEGVVEKKQDSSRPSSRCSGKINFDDRIVPGSISRPHSPLGDLATDEVEDKKEGITDSEVSTLLRDLVEQVFDKSNEASSSRPPSSGSGKISHDERIVPAALSRPQSPLVDEKESKEQQ